MNIKKKPIVFFIGISCVMASCALFNHQDTKQTKQEIKMEDTTARTPTKVPPRNSERTKAAPRKLEVK